MEPRNYESGAAAAPPSAPVIPSSGYPTAGDPQSATPATKPGPFWFYQFSEELRNVIVQAGLTPDSGDLMQIVTALRSAGLFTTPTLFDNTTKAATTEFVQRALGNLSTMASSTVTATIPQSAIGGHYQFYGSSGEQIISLPDFNYLELGASVWFVNKSTQPVSVSGNGINISALNMGLGESVAATLTVQAGDAILFSYNGISLWETFGYTSERICPSSKNSTGYRKDPSGLIEQWGVTSTISAGSALTITLPIPFPTAALNPHATPRNATPNSSVLTATAEVTSNSQITVVNTSTVPFSIWWQVKGH